MKTVIKSLWYSLPLQLLILHFRRYQILLLFWYILFATIAGNFMKSYGADTLFLAPEYFDKVSAGSVAITGFAVAVYIMSWNITTFILHGPLVSFLATTSQPFLKYCINNALLPIIFLVFYFIEAKSFSTNQQLLSNWDFIIFSASFIGAFLLSISIAFAYFFGADKTIYYSIGSKIKSANETYNESIALKKLPQLKGYLKIDWFLSAKLRIRKPRDVRHYNESFLKKILGRHHFAAVIAILVAFVFLITTGLVSNANLFQLPAAASILIFFSILIAVAGAFNIFFKSWSIVVILLLYLCINFLYQHEIIDPRNKAYGLNYENNNNRAIYTQESVELLASRQNVESDKKFYLQTLNNWKAKQKDSLPIMFIINTSGGGLRSATFTLHTIQKLDSIMGGELMNKTLFITGASGGILGAAYFRELYWQNLMGAKCNLQSKQYVNDISNDLLNPIFSSFVSRDIIGPVQKFTFNGFNYTKDRGYAFEEKLKENTTGIFTKQIKDYIEPEHTAAIPFLLLGSVISRDARKMIIASHPARFLMRPNCNNQIYPTDIDAIDFTSFFEKQNSKDLRFLSALRMNATFPFALPNVWLPSNPVIDVMDAGLRDNYGAETTLRFLDVFNDWIQKNTAKVVVLQIRDRSLNDWEKTVEVDNYLNFLTKPFSQIEHNWFKLQDYYQAGQINYSSNANKNLYTICWQYLPTQKNITASLSFHLSTAEKKDIINAVDNSLNKANFKQLIDLLKQKSNYK